jgi:hypothetical protein
MPLLRAPIKVDELCACADKTTRTKMTHIGIDRGTTVGINAMKILLSAEKMQTNNLKNFTVYCHDRIGWFLNHATGEQRKNDSP